MLEVDQGVEGGDELKVLNIPMPGTVVGAGGAHGKDRIPAAVELNILVGETIN